MRAVLLHYTAPPVTGGVEAVMHAHAVELRRAGYAVAVVAGRGEQNALPPGVELIRIPRMDTQDAAILQAGAALERGRLPETFSALSAELESGLAGVLRPDDVVLAHNVFGKHFNLPLTAALLRLMDRGAACRWIAWNHDLSWTSPNSRSKVHDGWPWDLLRTRHERMIPVAVSGQRRAELAGLYGVPEREVRVIYNGVDPQTLLGLSPAGLELIEKLDLLGGDLNLLMPVRITTAKNIELALFTLAQLERLGVNPRLVVTGPPDPHDANSMAYYERLRGLRRELGLDGKMHFVYELGANAGEGLTIGAEIVGELYRVCDALFMPSHREGFGMPVLEAGPAGLAVFCTPGVPAGVELAGSEAVFFNPDDAPESVAEKILAWAREDRGFRLRRRVRCEFTWRAIFERDIRPLLEADCPA